LEPGSIAPTTIFIDQNGDRSVRFITNPGFNAQEIMGLSFILGILAMGDEPRKPHYGYSDSIRAKNSLGLMIEVRGIPRTFSSYAPQQQQTVSPSKSDSIVPCSWNYFNPCNNHFPNAQN